MAEEKKPKIDLKARLGKKTVAAKSGSIPPPVGIPKPIPSPHFGGGRSAAPMAKVDASDPYAALPEHSAPVRPKQQAIKVEMSEEVVQAQKKGRSRIIALAAVTAAVGCLLGYAIGSGVERGKGAEAAISGATDLVKEVEAANVKVAELADVLKSAKEKLAAAKYPEEEVSKLGGINIPFEGANLTGKGIGRFRADVVTSLIDFASACEEANDQKEKIGNILGGSKTAIMDFLTQQSSPKVRWSVYVTNGPFGPWASMQPLPTPFPVKSDEKVKDKDGHEKAFSWPEEFKVADNGRTFELKRYKTGNPVSTGDPVLIPVDPTSQGSVCPSDVLVKLRRELGDLEDMLRGQPAGEGVAPEDEKVGLIERGRLLIERLKSIGKPS
jgi:hypothetical protein